MRAKLKWRFSKGCLSEPMVCLNFTKCYAIFSDPTPLGRWNHGEQIAGQGLEVRKSQGKGIGPKNGLMLNVLLLSVQNKNNSSKWMIRLPFLCPTTKLLRCIYLAIVISIWPLMQLEYAHTTIFDDLAVILGRGWRCCHTAIVRYSSQHKPACTKMQPLNWCPWDSPLTSWVMRDVDLFLRSSTSVMYNVKRGHLWRLIIYYVFFNSDW